MKILIDINHPAHVHFFKNLYWLFEKEGREVIVTASKKEMAFELLNKYNISFIDLGSYGNSVIQKAFNVPVMAYKMRKIIKKYQPDILMGIASSRICHGAIGLKKKTFVFTDTEHAKEQIALFKPFATKIFTPDCFLNDLGPKQIRYPGYHELAYLHPNWFTPNPDVLHEIGLNENDKFFILRFVSWKASHDLGQRGLSYKEKLDLVRLLTDFGKVIITSEKKLESELEPFRLNVEPQKIHDLLFYAALYIGEGGTMATEAACLGTPSIFISSLNAGTFTELQHKYDMLYSFNNSKYALNKINELLKKNDLKSEWYLKRKKLLFDKIDVIPYLRNICLNH